MTEEAAKPIDQKEINDNALAELDAYLPGVIESFYKKVNSSPAIQSVARELAKTRDRSNTLYTLLKTYGPGFPEHIHDIFKGTTWGARNDTVVMESIGKILSKKDQAKAEAEQKKNDYRVNKVDDVLNKAA